MLAQKLEQKLALIQEVNCEEDLSGLEKQDYLKKREAEQKKVETEMQKNFEKAKDAFLRTADSQHYEVLKMACFVYATWSIQTVLIRSQRITMPITTGESGWTDKLHIRAPS
jgi:hypothetical protein